MNCQSGDSRAALTRPVRADAARRPARRALLLGLLVAPFYAFAQGRARPARIAVLSDGHEHGNAHLWATFRKRLHELGYTEGAGYTLESRWARGDTERLPALAAELAALKADVIVAEGTPSALAVKSAISKTPIVAIRLANPVMSGLAASLARPGGNVTGTSLVTTDIAGKWLELLHEVAPAMKSLVFLTDTANPGGKLTLRELNERAGSLGVKVQPFDGRSKGNVEQAFSAIARERIGGLIVGTSPAILAQREQIVASAARQRISAIYAREEYVDAGGLMSYGADLDVHFSRAADYVHRILKGAKPADLPIEEPTRFKLVVNLKTARALGKTIPQSILVRANRVIE